MKPILTLALLVAVLTAIPASAQSIGMEGSDAAMHIAAIPHRAPVGSAVADPAGLRSVLLLDATFGEEGTRLDVGFTLRDPAQVTLLLLDEYGRPVLSSGESASFARGEHHLSVQTDDLPAGSYLLRLATSRGLAQRRIILTR